jgi:hypothetical protein
MPTRLRSGWLAGAGALLLVLSMSGVVMGATVLTALPGPDTEVSDPAADTDTTLTFEDADGDGVDDDCQAAVEPDPNAALDAEKAVDLDGDGVVSVSEAARSGRVGGKNCNHGGYVSLVAHAQGDACETNDPGDGDTDDGNTGGDASTGLPIAFDVDDVGQVEDDADATACTDDEDEEAEVSDDATVCEEVPAPEPPAEFTNVGAWVSAVARSDAVGGKNCNHGGAVSAAAKAAQEARDAARDARKAEQQAAKDARKAEREAAKDARKAEREAATAAREAAKAARQNGHGKGHGDND